MAATLVFFIQDIGAQDIIRQYNLKDPAHCYITPAMFVCQRCLKKGGRLLQILSFDEEGRPNRSYACNLEKESK